MKTIERMQIDLGDTVVHPQNRWFATVGAEWEEFAADVAARGVQEDLVVRLVAAPARRGAGVAGFCYQVLRGHRRRAAALAAGRQQAWVVVVECGDEEAFEHMWEGNLFRENVNAADEAVAVRVMMEEFGRTKEELAAKWARSIEWIETRQALLALGDEVLEAVRRPGRDRLTVGAVEEILRVPDDLRERAVQLVLHPALELGVLGAEQARQVLRHVLLEPRAASEAWEDARKGAGKAWRKRLELLCLPKTAGDLMLQTKSVAEAAELARHGVEAEEAVPLKNLLPSAPEVAGGLRWLHLAVKHGVPVLVLPGGAAGESRALVNQRMVTDAEAAMAEYGGGHWLVFGRKRIQSEESRDKEEERVAKAEADLAAGYDTSVPVDERPETVIEQGLERCAMVRIGEVERVREWAARGIAGDEPEGEEWLPKWAASASVYYEDVQRVCDWVLGLRV